MTVPKPSLSLYNDRKTDGVPWTSCYKSPSWVRVKGLSLHVWHEEIFWLVDNCLGRLVEIDEGIIADDNL